MSHFKERKEKNCLNCSTEVQGRYCHVCGQENVEPKESALHLVTHFFEDITHFDGKFFSSLKYLITRPGFLSKEYMLGRRASYLNPVRMYVFTSAIFFLLFFAANHLEEKKMDEVFTFNINGKTTTQIAKMDSASFANFTKTLNKEDDKAEMPMTREAFKKYVDSAAAESVVNFSDQKYTGRAAYDSAQALATDKDGWLQRKLMYKQFEMKEKYKGSANQMFAVLVNGLLHRLPQMMFIALPLLALLLKMLYRKQQQFYFVSHGIFCIHLYIFTFFIILAITGVNKLQAWSHWGIFGFIAAMLGFAAFFYMYKAMRNFYQQGRFKTILKFILLNILNFILLIFLFLLFLRFLSLPFNNQYAEYNR